MGHKLFRAAQRSYFVFGYLLGLFAVAAFYPVAVFAQQQNSPTSAVDVADVAQKARALLNQNRASEAIALLKETADGGEQAPELAWLLALAYVQDDNHFWALRTLYAIGARHPQDCEPPLWMAWISLQQGSLSEARDYLNTAHCADDTPSLTRRMLLFALLEQREGHQKTARRWLRDARHAQQIFTEDRVLMAQLNAALDAAHSTPPFTGKIELNLGGTTNARAGSPIDPGDTDTNAASALSQLNMWLRFVGPTDKLLRPTIEGELRAIGYASGSGRDFSYMLTGIRPGIAVNNSWLSALVAYHFETLLLAGSDRYDEGPLLFFNTHRIEVEASTNMLPNLTLFGGGGRRLFRESGRSRYEIDAGIGGSILPSTKLRLLGAMTMRWHSANNEAYDLWGGSALASAAYRLPRNWSVRAGALLNIDWYPNSTGYFDSAAPEARRRDLLLKFSASVFRSLFSGIKVGATYEYAKRFSEAGPYRYDDHRLLVKLAWTFTADPWAPRAVAPTDHVSLNHGSVSPEFGERLQELLRQEEAAQRGSSCVE